MQLAGIMITNGGAHPPEKWAAMTASQILALIVIEPTSPLFDAALIAKAQLEPKLVAALEGEHANVQAHEARKFKEQGNERLSHEYDPTGPIEAGLVTVVEATKGTMFEQHFTKPEVQGHLRRMLGQHFTSEMHIARSWVADANKDDEHAKRFHRRGGMPPSGDELVAGGTPLGVQAKKPR